MIVVRSFIVTRRRRLNPSHMANSARLCALCSVFCSTPGEESGGGTVFCLGRVSVTTNRFSHSPCPPPWFPFPLFLVSLVALMAIR